MMTRDAWCLVLWVLAQIVIASSRKDGSLIFVIDNTGSMGQDIAQVKDGVDAIMDAVLEKKSSPIKNIVLITFNDPGEYNSPRVKLVKKTDSRRELKSALSAIGVRGGGDCPEYSLSGIKRALEESYSNSYMFVFTDASAKDYYLTEEVITTAQKKGTQIVFIITPPRYCNEADYKFYVYDEIATATYGQVFRLGDKNQVTTIINEVVETSSGDKTVLVSKVIPESRTWSIVPFTIDDQIEYAVISASGKFVEYGDLTGPGVVYEKGTWLDNVKVLKLVNPAPGPYTVEVKGETRTTVVVYGRTDFTFQHGFSEHEVTSLLNTDKQSTSGTKYHLSIATNDPDHVIDLNAVLILNMDETVYKKLTLRKVSDHFYTTDLFMPPNSTFQIAVLGEGAYSHKRVMRTGKTPITPRIRRMKPELLHINGTTTYQYGNQLALTCKAQAFPPPAIVWRDGQGNIVPSQMFETIPPYDHEAHLTRTITQSDTYSCTATNELGSVSTEVDVLMEPIFIMPGTSKPYGPSSNQVLVEYGKPTTLYCNIKSQLPIQITWYELRRPGIVKPIVSSDKYSMSADRTELTIQKIDVDSEGEYSCKASLIADPNQNVIINHIVTISKQEPKLHIDGRTIYQYGDQLALTCKVQAFPAPVIEWRDGEGNIVPSQMSKSNPPYQHEAHITMSVTESDTYSCTATNELGSVSTIVNVLMKPPFIMPDTSKPNGIQPNSNQVPVEYGKPATLYCDIKSPLPIQITWYQVRGPGATRQILPSDKYSISADSTELTIQKMDVDLEGEYACKATLIADPNQNAIINHIVHIHKHAPQVKVLSNAKILPIGSPVRIRCRVVSGYPKPQISWQFKALGQDEYEIINIFNEVLYSASVDLTYSGHYKCVANNPLGRAEQEVEIIVTAKPVITLSTETDIANVPYNKKLTIICKVTAYPEPTVIWKDDKGNKILPGKAHRLSPLEYEVYLNIENVIESEKFHCHANNTLGETVSHVDVRVANPLVTDNNTSTTVQKVEYNEKVVVYCKIKSSLPMKISWSRIVRGTDEVISSSDPDLSISPDGTELQINKMDLSLEGKYKCKATLIEDENIEQTYVTDVKIQGLVAPKIATMTSDITTVEKVSVTILCKILNGNPKPKITWLFKSRDSGKIVNLDDTSEHLEIYNVGLKDTGEYKCVAANVVGEDEQSTVLIVEAKPKITVTSPTDIANVPYDSKITVTCKVTAHPEPTIVWKDDNGNVILPGITYAMSSLEYVKNLTIRNVKESRKFHCHASNIIGETVSHVEVRVVNPLVTDDNISTTVQKVKYNENVVVYCKIKSSLPMKITWSRIVGGTDKVISSSDPDLSISPDGTELKINKVDISLQGKYKCRATLTENENIEQIYITDVEIQGLVAPNIATMTREITTAENVSINIVCKILNGNPKPKLAWLFKRQGSGEFTNLDETGEQLEIVNVGLTDAGEYKCVATNIAGKDEKSTDLIVEAPPRIVNQNQIYWAVVGDIAQRIPCEVVGYPKPTVTWKVNGTKITSGRKYIIHGNDLVIKHPTEADSDNYTCEADNKFGKAEKTFLSIVSKTVPDEDRGEIEFVYILEGNTKKLMCPKMEIGVKGTKRGHYNWYRDGEIINMSAPIFVINNAGQDEDGDYTCRSSSIDGTFVKTYVVNVGYPPRFDNPTHYQSVDWSGDDLSLDCAAALKPTATVLQWFYNGKALPPTNITELQVFGFGNYTCRIGNQFGTIQKDFHITSSACLLKRKSDIGQMPLLLTKDTDISWANFKTTKKYFNIQKNENIILSCHNSPQTPNSFRNLNGISEVVARCDHEDKFIANGQSYKFSELHCKDPVTPDIVPTGKQCLNENTELIKVGFDVNSFIEVYEVCFDEVNKVPLYSKVNMTKTYNTGDGIKGAQWHKNPLYSKSDNEQYDCKNGFRCCLAKTQLVNAEDVRYGPAQAATFVDGLNSIAHWRPCTDISTISWNGLEESIRSLLSYYAEEFTVWSGASLYSNKNDTTTPRYLWKVVRFSPEEAVAIVHVNDPAPTPADVLCNPHVECQQLEWMIFTKFTYCCSVDSFATAFSIPENTFA